MTPDELHKRNLDAAILALTTEAGKIGYLYPAPKRALAKHISDLEAENKRLRAALIELGKDRARQAAVKPGNVTNIQPFHMYAEVDEVDDV